MVGSSSSRRSPTSTTLYERELHALNAMDFDDLLVRAVNLLRAVPGGARALRQRRSATCWSTSTRTPTTRSTAGCTCSPTSTATSPSSATTTSRSTPSAAPTSATSSTSSDDFPDAHVVKLEQNYRSTQTILDGGQRGDREQPRRKSKAPLDRPGRGRPVSVRELDGRARGGALRARRDRAAASTRASRARRSRSSTARTRSRACSRTCSCARRSPYQVVGGTKFYERAEIKDAIAYLSLLANPQDEVSFTRVANSPRRGIGQTSLSRVIAHAATRRRAVWDVGRRRRSRCPGSGRAAVKALGRFMDTMAELRARAEAAVPVGDLLEATAASERLRRGARGRAHDRGAGPHREPRGAGRRRARVRRERRGARRSTPSCSRSRSSADADTRARRRRPRHADDAAQREGPRVPGRLHHRLRGGRVPALALARRGRPSRRSGASATSAITRALRDLTLLYARRRTLFGAQSLRAAQPLPRRDPAGADRRARTIELRRAASPRRAVAGASGADVARRRAAGTRAARRSSGSARTSCTPRSARASSPASSPAGSSSCASRRIGRSGSCSPSMLRFRGGDPPVTARTP